MLGILFALSPAFVGFALLLLLRNRRNASLADPQLQTIQLLLFLGLGYAFFNIGIAKSLAPDQWIAAWLFFTVLSFASAYCLFHVVNMALTSRRIQLLIELETKPGQKSKPAYDSLAMVEQRLRRLERQGHIELIRGRYQQQGGLLYWSARLVYGWRLIIFPEKRGDK